MFTLPDLPYNYNALEPFIDEETMKIHHDKHHQAYIDKLNSAIESAPELAGKSIEELLKNDAKIVPDGIKSAVINHGGGHYNHSFFWKVMCPSSSSGEPKGEFLDAIKKTFGSVDDFKEKFTEKAMGVFGSGWAWLMKTPDGKLALKRHSFQNNPVMRGNIPILGLDVWEHAYYLKYQNRRADYIKAWWSVVNWSQVENFWEK